MIKYRRSAQEQIRTATPLRVPPPQDGASTNFATWAYKLSLGHWSLCHYAYRATGNDLMTNDQ